LSLDDTSECHSKTSSAFSPQIEGLLARHLLRNANRQMAVQQMAKNVDGVLVLGSANSSNSNRLVEVAEKSGGRAYLIDDSNSINPDWLKEAKRVGITAGASSPELLIEKVLQYLGNLGFLEIEELHTVAENVHFALPPELAAANN
jgi:4-hydroxy-3-methylbut-2-enyl diphosphate reductase